jgi:peroxiredoxin
MNRLSSLIVLLMLSSATLAIAQESAPPTLEIGQPAPDFALPYATRDSIARTPIKLSDFRGKRNVILAFYPANWSSGCTKQLCMMRDDFHNLEQLNAEILAISGDYVFSHHEWAKHHNLPFKLLSDHSHEVAKQYNSYNEKTGFNKRTVFIIDKQGKIAYMDLQYSVADDEDFNRLKQAFSTLR